MAKGKGWLAKLIVDQGKRERDDRSWDCIIKMKRKSWGMLVCLPRLSQST